MPLSCRVVCRRVVLKIQAMPCCKLVSRLELIRVSAMVLEFSKVELRRGVFSNVLLKRLKAGKTGIPLADPAHVALKVEHIPMYMAEQYHQAADDMQDYQVY